MESILNPAYPHIFEKIFLCLNRDSILNFRLLNHHWKNTLENVFTKDLAKLMLLRKFKELADIISIITYRYILQKLGKIWLNLIQFLNQENLWSRDVTENMFLCINRICCLIERRKCKPDYYLDTYYYLEPKYVAFNLCKKFGKMSLIKIIINPAYSANFMISSSHDEDCCLCLFSDDSENDSDSDIEVSKEKKRLKITRARKNCKCGAVHENGAKKLKKRNKNGNLYHFTMKEFHSVIQNGFTHVVQELIQYVDLIHQDWTDANAFRTAIYFGNYDMLKVLFEAYIRAHIGSPEYEKAKMDHNETKIHSLNPIRDNYKGMPPLYIAAINGHIRMVKLFVQHINYVDNVNEKWDGLAAIEAAANAGHFEIVNILMPLSTDLEFSTWSEIFCTCIKLKQFIQDKINHFILQTKTIGKPLVKHAQVIARSYLSKHNWNLKSAINSYARFKGDFGNLITDYKRKVLLDFKEKNNHVVLEDSVAISYLLQNNWNCGLATDQLLMYRSIFDEWKKWAKKQDQKLQNCNCNCCELANPVKDWWKPPDIDFSVTALYDSDNEVGNAEDLYEEDDEDEEVADDEENFD